MMYFTNGASSKMVFDKKTIGFIVTPTKVVSGSAVSKIDSGYKWICDNGMFTGKFEESRYLRFLDKMKVYRDRCVFVVVPDVLEILPDKTVVGNAKKTLEQFETYAPKVRAMGYRVAFVAQDGQEDLPFPDNFDALFVGGSTEWKLGKASECIKRAKAIGKYVHVGRVNSGKRFRKFQCMGVDSVDGTHLVFKPDVHLLEIKSWVQQPVLFMEEM